MRCFFVGNGTEDVELGVAAEKYDKTWCAGCSNHHDCKTLIDGAEQKPIEEADFRHHEKIDNEGADVS